MLQIVAVNKKFSFFVKFKNFINKEIINLFLVLYKHTFSYRNLFSLL